MVSKYKRYWLSIINKIHDGIQEAIDNNTKVLLDIKDIKNYGNRGNWYGTVELTPNGIKGGEMAHAMALGKTVMAQEFYYEIQDKRIQLKINSSFMLEIDVSDTEIRTYNKTKPVLNDRPKLFNDRELDSKSILEQLYQTLDKLPLFDHSYDPKALPENGIYFFFEEGEKCQINGKVWNRIVRIGTHNADNRFRDRIRNHYKGNKNSSVFRTHVGSAIIQKNKISAIDVTDWMKHMTPTNKDIEKLIDIVFKNEFKFRCVSVPTKKERLYLEEGVIALLSNSELKSTPNWLGNYAAKQEIRNSYLWNIQHVNSSNLLKESDMNLFQDKIRSTQFIEQTTLSTIPVESGLKKEKILCFIPCCGSKYPSGEIIKPERKINVQDLSNTWNNLEMGRNTMKYCIEDFSPQTSALYLYTGSPYQAFRSNYNKIEDLVKSGRMRLIIISAGYGIVDAFEPINNYDAQLVGQVASKWKEFGLSNSIAEIIIKENPESVYGFFAGQDNWSNPSSKYRYFFTEGLKLAIKSGFKPKISGCFYREEGRGVKAILNSLGRVFRDLILSDFNDSFIIDLTEVGRWDGNVKIRFDEILGVK